MEWEKLSGYNHTRLRNIILCILQQTVNTKPKNERPKKHTEKESTELELNGRSPHQTHT